MKVLGELSDLVRSDISPAQKDGIVVDFMVGTIPLAWESERLWPGHTFYVVTDDAIEPVKVPDESVLLVSKPQLSREEEKYVAGILQQSLDIYVEQNRLIRAVVWVREVVEAGLVFLQADVYGAAHTTVTWEIMAESGGLNPLFHEVAWKRYIRPYPPQILKTSLDLLINSNPFLN